jgi:hypothetical protein
MKKLILLFAIIAISTGMSFAQTTFTFEYPNSSPTCTYHIVVTAYYSCSGSESHCTVSGNVSYGQPLTLTTCSIPRGCTFDHFEISASTGSYTFDNLPLSGSTQTYSGNCFGAGSCYPTYWNPQGNNHFHIWADIILCK